MPGLALILPLKIASLAGSALVAGKLFRTGLYLRYRVFFSYFVFRVLNSVWPFCLDIRSAGYQKLWIITSPLSWLFYILLVFELYALTLGKYKGIYTLGRRVMYLGIAVSVAISAMSLIPKIKPEMPQRSTIIGCFFAAERGIDFSLAIFILLIMLFLAFFPVPLSRNVKVHAALYSAYFLSSTLVLLLRSTLGLYLKDEVDLLLMGASCGCIIGWMLLLTPEGEAVRSGSPPARQGEEARLLSHLDALNRTLLKLSIP